MTVQEVIPEYDKTGQCNNNTTANHHHNLQHYHHHQHHYKVTVTWPLTHDSRNRDMKYQQPGSEQSWFGKVGELLILDYVLAK